MSEQLKQMPSSGEMKAMNNSQMREFIKNNPSLAKKMVHTSITIIVLEMLNRLHELTYGDNVAAETIISCLSKLPFGTGKSREELMDLVEKIIDKEADNYLTMSNAYTEAKEGKANA